MSLVLRSSATGLEQALHTEGELVVLATGTTDRVTHQTSDTFVAIHLVETGVCLLR